MNKANSFFALLLLTIIALMSVSTGTSARSGTVLAEDYPYSVVFTAMARRGVLDYAVVNQHFPASLSEVYNAGYMAYELPATCQLDYSNGGSYAELSSQGKPQLLGVEMVEPLDETIDIPNSTPYHVESLGMYDEVDGKMQWVNNKETRVYHWQGAEWVANGMPREELGTALRYYRIWAHLCFTGYDYREFNGTMPASLSDLEAFIGTSRNPVAWQGVTVVDSLSAVQSAPGTLFAGTDSGDWVVSCNVGPQIVSARYTYKRGEWKLIGDTFKY